LRGDRVIHLLEFGKSGDGHRFPGAGRERSLFSPDGRVQDRAALAAITAVGDKARHLKSLRLVFTQATFEKLNQSYGESGESWRLDQLNVLTTEKGQFYAAIWVEDLKLAWERGRTTDDACSIAIGAACCDWLGTYGL